MIGDIAFLWSFPQAISMSWEHFSDFQQAKAHKFQGMRASRSTCHLRGERNLVMREPTRGLAFKERKHTDFMGRNLIALGHA